MKGRLILIACLVAAVMCGLFGSRFLKRFSEGEPARRPPPAIPGRKPPKKRKPKPQPVKKTPKRPTDLIEALRLAAEYEGQAQQLLRDDFWDPPKKSPAFAIDGPRFPTEAHKQYVTLTTDVHFKGARAVPYRPHPALARWRATWLKLARAVTPDTTNTTSDIVRYYDACVVGSCGPVFGGGPLTAEAAKAGLVRRWFFAADGRPTAIHLVDERKHRVIPEYSFVYHPESRAIVVVAHKAYPHPPVRVRVNEEWKGGRTYYDKPDCIFTFSASGRLVRYFGPVPGGRTCDVENPPDPPPPPPADGRWRCQATRYMADIDYMYSFSNFRGFKHPSKDTQHRLLAASAVLEPAEREAESDGSCSYSDVRKKAVDLLLHLGTSESYSTLDSLRNDPCVGQEVRAILPPDEFTKAAPEQKRGLFRRMLADGTVTWTSTTAKAMRREIARDFQRFPVAVNGKGVQIVRLTVDGLNGIRFAAPPPKKGCPPIDYSYTSLTAWDGVQTPTPFMLHTMHELLIGRQSRRVLCDPARQQEGRVYDGVPWDDRSYVVACSLNTPIYHDSEYMLCFYNPNKEALTLYIAINLNTRRMSTTTAESCEKLFGLRRRDSSE